MTTRREGEVVGTIPQEAGYNRRIRAERNQYGHAEELQRQQDAAKGWQPTQIAVLGLVSVVGTLKGTDKLQEMHPYARWVAIVAMVSALLAACGGLALLASSAWPMPPLRRREGAPGEASVVKRIGKTRLRARLGLGATFAALMLLATAVLTTWVPTSKAPSKNNLVRVTTRTGSFCGALRPGAGTAVNVGIGEQTVPVPIGEVLSIAPADKCS